MAQWQCKSTHPHCKALLSQGDFPQIIKLILLFVVFYTCWLQKHAYTWLIYLFLCIWIATAMMVCLEMVRQEYLKRHARFYDLVSWVLPAYKWWIPGQCYPLHYAHAEFWVWGWSWKMSYAVLLYDLLIPEEISVLIFVTSWHRSCRLLSNLCTPSLTVTSNIVFVQMRGAGSPDYTTCHLVHFFFVCGIFFLCVGLIELINMRAFAWMDRLKMHKAAWACL
jgi:hypothetical protein